MFDLTVLIDPVSRANFYADHASDDADTFIQGMIDACEDYASRYDVEELPPELCGPVSATFAFAVLVKVATQPLPTYGDLLAALGSIAENAEHAVNVHSDPVAEHVFNTCDTSTSIGEAYARLTEWVADTLWSDADPDAFIASVTMLPTDAEPDGIGRPDDVA